MLGLSEVFQLYTAGDELFAHEAELLVDANPDAGQLRQEMGRFIEGGDWDRCEASVADSVNAV